MIHQEAGAILSALSDKNPRERLLLIIAEMFQMESGVMLE
jgi:hypothetical protein